MKKFVLAYVMALASSSLISAPAPKAQEPEQITIKDPAEFYAYQKATTQSDPKAKAVAMESFLQTYPQSATQKVVLDLLVDTYQAERDSDGTFSAASRLLQLDPDNMKAIVYSVFIKKSQGAKTGEAQTLDDAAALARKGLATAKPADVSFDEWKKITGGSYPIFHSAIALDDIASKKDIKAGISEYRTELMLYPPDATKSGPGLWDTLQLAEAYTKPDGEDLVQAVWFYSRAWNFAPAPIQSQIEKKLWYYYRKVHGNMNGLDAVKAESADSLFPPATFVISPATTPAELGGVPHP